MPKNAPNSCEKHHRKKKKTLWFETMKKVARRNNATSLYSVFSFGSENWSWTIHTMDRLKRWETKMMMCVFRFKREGRDMGRISHKMRQRRQEDLDKDGFTILV